MKLLRQKVSQYQGQPESGEWYFLLHSQIHQREGLSSLLMQEPKQRLEPNSNRTYLRVPEQFLP